MNLPKALTEDFSTPQISRIVKWIGTDQKRFDQLFKLFIGKGDLLVQRAAWVLSHAALKQPELVQKHLSKIIKNLQKPGLHDTVKRNSVRILQRVSIPEKLHGLIMDICFAYIADPKEKPAIKAFSLTVLENLSKHYPEIKSELKLIIEERWEHETAAVRSRARKILKKL
jgi:hypothetical protein